MSKLRDKLQRLYRMAPAIGFRTMASAPQSPPMLIIARLVRNNEQEARIAVNSGADAVLVNDSSDIDSLERLAEAMGDIPIGVSLKKMSGQMIAKVMDSRCDFAVFNLETPVALLYKEEIGKILEVKGSLEHSLLRAINDLPIPIDAVAIDEVEIPFLSLEHLLICRRFVQALDKPLLLSLPLSVTRDELQNLVKIGISGIFVSPDSEDKLKEIRKAADSLPWVTIKRHPEAVLLPQITPTGTEEEEEEEEGI